MDSDRLNRWLSLAADAIAISIEHPEKMTYADFMAVDAWLYSSMNLFYRNYELAQEGLFSERDWQAGVEANAPASSDCDMWLRIARIRPDYLRS